MKTRLLGAALATAWFMSILARRGRKGAVAGTIRVETATNAQRVGTHRLNLAPPGPPQATALVKIASEPPLRVL